MSTLKNDLPIRVYREAFSAIADTSDVAAITLDDNDTVLENGVFVAVYDDSGNSIPVTSATGSGVSVVLTTTVPKTVTITNQTGGALTGTAVVMAALSSHVFTKND